MEATNHQQHRSNYDALFCTACGPDATSMSQSVAVGILRGSNVSMEGLKQIWALAAHRGLPSLGLDEFYVAARLVAFAQTHGAASVGPQVVSALDALSLPLATFGAAYDQPAPAAERPYDSRAREYYLALFRGVAGGDEGSSIGGRAAVGFFTASGLPKEMLRHIWSLADCASVGALNAARFEMGCRFIALAQSGRGSSVSPLELELARASDPSFDAQLARFEGHALPPAAEEPLGPPPTPEPTPSPAAGAAATAADAAPDAEAELTPPPSSPPPADGLATTTPVVGVPTTTNDAHYATLFDQLDAAAGGSGVLGGGTCAGFLQRSLLSKVDLRQVWALASEGEAELDRAKWTTALKLCAVVQSGADIHRATSAAQVLTAHPMPPCVILDGIASSPQQEEVGVAAGVAAAAELELVAGDDGSNSSNAGGGGGHDEEEEKAYYERLAASIVGSDGKISGGGAFPLLVLSGLPKETLKEVWDLADPNGLGHLTSDAFGMACRLISLVQHGRPLSIDAAQRFRELDLALATFDKHPAVVASPAQTSQPSQPISSRDDADGRAVSIDDAFGSMGGDDSDAFFTNTPEGVGSGGGALAKVGDESAAPPPRAAALSIDDAFGMVAENSGVAVEGGGDDGSDDEDDWGGFAAADDGAVAAAVETEEAGAEASATAGGGGGGGGVQEQSELSAPPSPEGGAATTTTTTASLTPAVTPLVNPAIAALSTPIGRSISIDDAFGDADVGDFYDAYSSGGGGGDFYGGGDAYSSGGGGADVFGSGAAVAVSSDPMVLAAPTATAANVGNDSDDDDEWGDFAGDDGAVAIAAAVPAAEEEEVSGGDGVEDDAEEWGGFSEGGAAPSALSIVTPPEEEVTSVVAGPVPDGFVRADCSSDAMESVRVLEWPSDGSFEDILDALIDCGRFEEAAMCAEHCRASADRDRFQREMEQAIATQHFEKCISLRENIAEAESRVRGEDAVAQWRALESQDSSSSGGASIRLMAAEVRQLVGSRLPPSLDAVGDAFADSFGSSEQEDLVESMAQPLTVADKYSQARLSYR